MKDYPLVKSGEDIEKIREGSRLLADILYRMSKLIYPGNTADELEYFAEKEIRKNGAKSAFKGYKKYPHVVCVSVDEEVVHGFPLKRKKFTPGMIVSVDIGIIYEGLYSDTAYSFGIPPLPPEREAFLKHIQKTLYLAIRQARAGNRVGDISRTIQRSVEAGGYSVVRELFGHGVGYQLHEDPAIPNYEPESPGMVLKKNMVLAIEVMANMGSPKVQTLSDGWTVVAIDHLPSSHFEHTVLVRKGEPEILTHSPLWDENDS
ncbi:MAG: type I methionyl aminopeptidase [bacterium JZ-2024 1]